MAAMENKWWLINQCNGGFFKGFCLAVGTGASGLSLIVHRRFIGSVWLLPWMKSACCAMCFFAFGWYSL
jgi:hypothetical protein